MFVPGNILFTLTGFHQMLLNENYSDSHVMSGIIGAIDGSHIPIKAPSVSPSSYVNRKGAFDSTARFYI